MRSRCYEGGKVLEEWRSMGFASLLGAERADALNEWRTGSFFPRSAVLGTCRKKADFDHMIEKSASRLTEAGRIEAADIRGSEQFELDGFCAFCNARSHFVVAWHHCFVLPDGSRVPNWREHLTCQGCGLNNRMRAAACMLLDDLGVRQTVYLTEEITQFFAAVRSRHALTSGSEFLSDGTPSGCRNDAGIRHEDLTRLSLSPGSIDRIGCFDVLEHIADYREALRQIASSLKRSGRLIMTVPFDFNSIANVVRASLSKGTVIHHLPPEYHGDPLNEAGVLCFYHFGWELLAEMRELGFRDASQTFYWSRRYGHLGGTQAIIEARR